MSKQTMLSPVFLFPLLVVLFILTAAPMRVQAQDQPTIAKDSVWASVDGKGCDYEERGCPQSAHKLVPGLEFVVNGPIPSQSQFWAEFSVAGKPSVKVNCALVGHKVKPGDVVTVTCNKDRSEGRSHGIVYAGALPPTAIVSFTIGASNELQQMNLTLFSGKMKVGTYRFRQSPDLTYYVDEDWRLPIAYIGFAPRPGETDLGHPGQDEPEFHVAFTLRGQTGDIGVFLFRKGEEVANETCRHGINSEYNPAGYEWYEIDCKLSVYPSELKKTPGDHEIKIMSAGHLARTIKFTVAADGTLDNGVATANHLDTARILVPAAVLEKGGNPEAWKTGAYYGNPLTGFTLPQ